MLSKAPEWKSYKEAPIKGNLLKRFLKSRFRFVDYPFVMAYRGFGNTQKMLVQGHVFRGMTQIKPTKKKSLKNLVNLIKMYLVRTVDEATVTLHLPDGNIEAATNDNGYFEFELEDHQLPVGWHTFKISLNETLVEGQEKVEAITEVLITDKADYGIISDVDDTLLVSNITNPLKNAYLLITRSSEGRRPFEGTVDFYQQLNCGRGDVHNPFFFVSSAEWNFYEYFKSFMDFHEVPKGILQLRELKDHWTDFLNTDFKNHQHKTEKIDRILRFYPDSAFVLIGDNGQQDINIYKEIVSRFPNRIKAVYIRMVNPKRKARIEEKFTEAVFEGIPTLQFEHSAEAEKHASELGLI